MAKNLKALFIGFFAVFLLGLGANLMGTQLENFFYWNEISKNPQLAAAWLNQQNLLQEAAESKPRLKAGANELNIEADSVISVFVDNNGKEKVLFDKNSSAPLPIASLTKLAGALIIIDNYSFDRIIEITGEAAGKPGNGEGNLKQGSQFRTDDLFKIMLIESNNSAALAIAQAIGENNFTALMNKKAEALGLKDTYFINPTGLDSNDSSEINRSTARDLADLSYFIIKEKPQIFETLLIKEFDLYDIEGVFNHKAVNTNELLGKIPLIVGGKTGETPQSNGCLLLAIRAPKNKGYLINVILNSRDRFAEMEKLVGWVEYSHSW